GAADDGVVACAQQAWPAAKAELLTTLHCLHRSSLLDRCLRDRPAAEVVRHPAAARPMFSVATYHARGDHDAVYVLVLHRWEWQAGRRRAASPPASAGSPLSSGVLLQASRFLPGSRGPLVR